MYQFDPAISSTVMSDEPVVQNESPLATAPLDEATLGRMHRY